ncbi:MAG: alpha/beta fold hydrolase [Myxococcales bacterium]|nr:alpha/beta fold hydrolase [Myxococcales bacterium]
MHIAFLHGLESGPHGRKYQALAAALGEVIAPDCEGVMNVEARLQRVVETLQGRGPVILVGSSFGGLIAGLLASQPDHGLEIAGMVLCAPAFHVPAADPIDRCPMPCVVLHGQQDDIVPIEASRVFAKRFGCTLIELADDHRLSHSVERLVAEVGAMAKRLTEGKS